MYEERNLLSLFDDDRDFQKDLNELSNPLTFFCRRIILTLIPIFNTDVWGEKNAEKVSHATPLLHYKSLLRSMYLLCCCCSLGNEAVHTEMENFEEKQDFFWCVCTQNFLQTHTQCTEKKNLHTSSGLLPPPLVRA